MAQVQAPQKLDPKDIVKLLVALRRAVNDQAGARLDSRSALRG
ncbi:hypothetical protein [Pseudomonas asplenii]|nr:hypothetical protein [Pseudomonas fuscovaginae]